MLPGLGALMICEAWEPPCLALQVCMRCLVHTSDLPIHLHCVDLFPALLYCSLHCSGNDLEVLSYGEEWSDGINRPGIYTAMNRLNLSAGFPA